MALFLSSHLSILSRNPNPSPNFSRQFSLQPKTSSLSFSKPSHPSPSSFRLYSSLESDSDPSPIEASSSKPSEIADERGEESEPETEPESSVSNFDRPNDEYEWGEGGGEDEAAVTDIGNGSAASSSSVVVEEEDVGGKLGDLKRALVDTFYGTELGFRASSEVRGEVLELVNQLEAVNPTPAPTESAVLDGNWVLLYTSFSELLPLLATGSTPFLKVKNIYQAINTQTLTIDNATTLASPFAEFSFSASATFEVRSSSRIQVRFKEGTFKPPEISSSLSLPQNIDIFGQKIDLTPVQSSLNPLQEGIANIARTISGQPPLKVPIPGERSSSWLLITYLDDDFRISRGDGGLFILAKEGSSLLDQ